MNKKKLIILISIIITLAILICVGVFAISGSKKAKIEDKLDLGEKYLEELKYEKALAAYKEVLEIDPKNVDAYLGIVDTYVEMGEYEKALKYAEEAYEETGEDIFAERIEEIEALNSEGTGAFGPDDIVRVEDIIWYTEATREDVPLDMLETVPDSSVTYVAVGGHGNPDPMGVHFQNYAVGANANPDEGYRYVRCESDTIEFYEYDYNESLGYEVPWFLVPESGHHYIYLYYEPITGASQPTAEPQATPVPEEVTDDIKTAVEVKVVYDYEELYSESFGTWMQHEGATIVGIAEDGTEVWKYEATKCPRLDFPQISEVGIHKNVFYFNDKGSLIAFEIETGAILWKVEWDSISIAHYTFDEDGNMYLTGSDGPDLLIIDPQGNVLKRVESLDEEYYWSYDITLNGEYVFISYEGYSDLAYDGGQHTLWYCLSDDTVGYDTEVLQETDEEMSVSYQDYFEILPLYPETGQTYWVIFREGHRSQRIELSTFDVVADGREPYIVWDRELTINNASYEGECNQYYLNELNEWEYMRSYNLLSNWCAEVLFSNVDVYDGSGNLILKANNIYESTENPEFTVVPTPDDYVIDWIDPNLEARMREVTGIYDRDIMYGDVKDITELDLSHSEINDISALSNMRNLEHLDAAWNDISDISALSILKNLEYLNMTRNSISDISTLSNLTSLESLKLSNNEISDISTLSNLLHMRVLWLSNNEISDICPLSNLADLESLDLNENSISDISSLSNLTNLTTLNLDHNNISDISALSNLTSLESLALCDNSITDISALSSLIGLRYLGLSENAISDIGTLSMLTNLTDMELDDNEISDISALSNLISLERLGLSNNPITDYSPVSHVPGVNY